MWFTENPWPPIVILGFAGCVLAGGWFAQRRGIWVVAALACFGGCAAIYAAERAIVTEGEKVEANVYTLAFAFQKKDRDRVLSFFSMQAPEWRSTVAKALDLVDVQDDLDVKDMSVRISGENSRAVTHFRANATVAYQKMGVGFQPSRWELQWQREGGEWKIVDVTRLDPFKDKELEVFEERR